MNNSENKHSSPEADELLKNLYQRRKQNIDFCDAAQDPLLLAKLDKRRHSTTDTPIMSFKSYLSLAATIFTIAISLIIVDAQMQSTQDSKELSLANEPYISVELHVLSSREELSINTQQKMIEVQYQDLQKAKLDDHQVRFAKVLEFNEDLALLTCDKELIKISKPVLDILFKSDQTLASKLSKGQTLALDSTYQGTILALRTYTSEKQCG